MELKNYKTNLFLARDGTLFRWVDGPENRYTRRGVDGKFFEDVYVRLHTYPGDSRAEGWNFWLSDGKFVGLETSDHSLHLVKVIRP